MAAFSEILEPNESYPTEGKAPHSFPKMRIGVTPGFNVALFVFSSALGIFKFLASEKPKELPLGGLLALFTLDGIRFLTVVLITAGFLAAFWRRLVSSLFPVRPLNYQEAIAIVLMLDILFGR